MSCVATVLAIVGGAMIGSLVANGAPRLYTSEFFLALHVYLTGVLLVIIEERIQ